MHPPQLFVVDLGREQGVEASEAGLVTGDLRAAFNASHLVNTPARNRSATARCHRYPAIITDGGAGMRPSR
jgi:hypothetical protein